MVQESSNYCSEESRRIHCTKCGNSHIWICTNRTKVKARWCQVVQSLNCLLWLLTCYSSLSLVQILMKAAGVQDCCQYHQAKDGDGWVEYKGSLVFNRPQKVSKFHSNLYYLERFMRSSVQFGSFTSSIDKSVI